MTLVRRNGETQRAFVERTLRERGTVATYDLLYNARGEDGRPTSVTRLAAIVHQLRTDGWEITTVDSPGMLAFYRLISSPHRGWKCAACGSRPVYDPAPVLGGMAQGKCPKCGAAAAFRWAA